MASPDQAHQAASKLAQLLGEVLVHHAPHTARIDAETRQRFTEEFLEGLESHTAKMVGPILQKVLDSSDMPDEFAGLLKEAIAPGAQFSAFLEQIFIYGIAQSIISASVQPFLQGVVNDVSQVAVHEGISRPVDPATIATAAARGLQLGSAPTLTVPGWAYTEAAKNGLSADAINLLASIVGIPPALQELFELYRRGIITIDQVKTGLREGDFRDDWIDWTVQLAHGWLTPLDFVRAAVQEQLPYADAKRWAESTGLDVSTPLPLQTDGTELTPDMFGLAVGLGGRPPGPQELVRMTLRGIIQKDGSGAGAITFQQGIAESDVKTKWTEPLWQLGQYVPPPETVGTLLERGAVDKPTAIGLWKADGVPDALAQGYAYIAEQQHIGQDKLLARGQILTGYFDGLFSRDQATGLLNDVGLSGTVANELLDITDFRREITAINAVVRRISTLYGAGKLDGVRAKSALLTVGLSDTQATEVLVTWNALRIQPIHLPTVAEIGLAFKYGTIDQPTAIAEIEALGYEPRDATIVLSAHATTLIASLPPAGTGVTG